MQRRVFFLALLLLLQALPALGQQPYVDPALRILLQPDGIRAAEAALAIAPPEERPLVGPLALDREGPAGTARVGTLIRLRTPDGLQELRAAGAEIGVVIGDIVTARIPLAALERLTGSVRLETIEAARVVDSTNDVSIPLIRADRVRSQVGGVWQGFAGQGVIVGVYDSGLDLSHEDFRNADGTTRVVALWDQSALQGPPPPGFQYGLLCTASMINGGACPQIDTNGHGTHVAGSAAGNGRATAPIGDPGRYAGVAPAADLAIVKGGRFDPNRNTWVFTEDVILEGIAWVFQEATRQGKAAVVNLSLGGQMGPHDGTRLYEQGIDALSGPGRIVVVAAGNEGGHPNAVPIGAQPPLDPQLIHAMGQPVAGVPQELVFDVVLPANFQPAPGGRANLVLMTLWHAGTDAMDVAVIRPDGSSVTARHGEFQGGAAAGGWIGIWNAQQRNPQNQDFEIQIEISNHLGGGVPAAGTWRIRITPTVTTSGRPYHLWIGLTSPAQLGAFGRGGFTNSHTVGMPGTARRAVTVGAYVPRQSWTSLAGNLQWTYQEPIGDIADFSSTGPTRDGRLKPEITAPGKTIMSSLSINAPRPSNNVIAPGERHRILNGTSMAAPHVAGAVAILLQRAPGLTPENIKAIFAEHSIRDAFTNRSYVTGDPGGFPNFTWGYGKLNVEASLAATAAFARVSALAVAAAPVALPQAPLTERGARIPLLRLALQAEGPEAVDVQQLAFDLTGQDPGAQLLVFHDVAGNGVLDAGDPQLGAVPAPLQPGQPTRVVVPVALRVQPGVQTHLIVALVTSGAVPHRTDFRAVLVPAETRGIGAETREPSPLRASGLDVPAVRTTVLRAGEAYVLNQNPVRTAPLVINFHQRPEIAIVYTLAGQRVRDLRPEQVGASRVEWDLTNDQGSPVAPGIYLLVIRVGNETFQERLIIVRAAGTDGEE